MPPVPTYPNVHVEEIPSGIRTISGVATSIAAFVGPTKLGPVNDAVEISSWADYERCFGGLWHKSPLSLAVHDFYQNGGGRALVVRIFSPTAASATAAGTVAAQKVAAAAEGAVASAVNAQVIADAAKREAETYPPGSLEHTVGIALAKRAADFANEAGNADKKQKAASELRSAVALEVARAAQDLVAATRACFTLGTHLKLTATSEGSWANGLRVRMEVPGSDGLFTLLVRDQATGSLEIFEGLSLDPDHPERVDRVLESASRLVRVDRNLTGGTPTQQPTVRPEPGRHWWEDASAGAPNAFIGADKDVSDGDEPNDTNVEGSLDNRTGLYALEAAEDVNLLCIPPHRFGELGDIGGGLIDAAIRYCTLRRALFLIDPPSHWRSKSAAVSGINTDAIGLPSPNAAIYFPRIRRPNPVPSAEDEFGSFAPCGAVAGVIARTDGTFGIWKAPAGRHAWLADVPELDVPVTDAENGALNTKGINCLRAFPTLGHVVWGARTRAAAASSAGDWKYLPVRRTALYLEESLYRGTRWIVFEPIGEALFKTIRLTVGSFLHQLFQDGAFLGATPRDAYFVRCDKSTTTEIDVNQGVVNILVGFAPLRPAEFVIIHVQQIAGQREA